jgi:hypothetical protein
LAPLVAIWWRVRPGAAGLRCRPMAFDARAIG